MRLLRPDDVLKGAYLGLWLYFALAGPTWDSVGRALLWSAGGAAAGGVLGLLNQFRRGRRDPGGPMFLLWEHPLLVTAGLLGGLAAAVFPEQDAGRAQTDLAYCVAGGAALALALSQFRAVADPVYRAAAMFAASAAAWAGLVYWLKSGQTYFADLELLGGQLLAGLPLFYLLVLVSDDDQTAADPALMFGALGAALWLIPFPPNTPQLGIVLAAALYATYFRYVMPGLRVYRHVVLGSTYLRQARLLDSLRAYRRALELDPRSELARAGLRQLHLSVDVTRFRDDPEVLKALDYRECLHRVAELLSGGEVPGGDQRAEAGRLLELVETQKPDWAAETMYHRALLATHEKDLEAAVGLLQKILDPDAWRADDAPRRRVLLSAWQLSLVWHPRLRERVGTAELAKPRRRMEAIAAVERHRKRRPDDVDVEPLRELLYESLTEAEYREAAASGRAEPFDFELAERLGLAAIDDPSRRQRGVEFLNIAGTGLRHRAPSLLGRVADVYRGLNQLNPLRLVLQEAVKAGMEVGIQALQDDQRKAYYDAVRQLGEDADKNGDLDEAARQFGHFSQSEFAGPNVYRRLADVHERRGDLVAAVRAVEGGLAHDGKDADLLDRKARYYYSLSPDVLKDRAGEVRPFFDAEYCKRVARHVLSARDADADQLDWALHVIRLARVMQPDGLAVRSLLARSLMRRGERDGAVRLLEDIREAKPGGGEEEDAWFAACQHLGRLYLEEYDRPDLAAAALEDFRRSHKSGADTIFLLAQAYERAGEIAKARQHYHQVTAYEQHRLAGDARDALDRLRDQANAGQNS